MAAIRQNDLLLELAAIRYRLDFPQELPRKLRDAQTAFDRDRADEFERMTDALENKGDQAQPTR